MVKKRGLSPLSRFVYILSMNDYLWVFTLPPPHTLKNIANNSCHMFSPSCEFGSENVFRLQVQMDGPSKQETEFTKRTPTNGNESVGRRAEQNFVLKLSLMETHDKTHSYLPNHTS